MLCFAFMMTKNWKCKGKHIPWNRIENGPDWKDPFSLTFSINCKKNDWAIIVDCDCHTDPKSLLDHWHDDSFIFSFFSLRSNRLIFFVTQERDSFFWPKKEAKKKLTPSFIHWFTLSWPKEEKKKTCFKVIGHFAYFKSHNLGSSFQQALSFDIN